MVWHCADGRMTPAAEMRSVNLHVGNSSQRKKNSSGWSAMDLVNVFSDLTLESSQSFPSRKF